MKERWVYSTVREAQTHHLPPIGFKVERMGAIFDIEKFPAPEYYLVMVGRLDSREQFVVREYKSNRHDYATLDRMIRRSFSGPKHIPLRLHERTHITLAGEKRIAREFTTSRGSTQRHWCAALVPSPNGAPYGLLVFFGVSAVTRQSRESPVLSNPIHSEIAHSFRLSINDDAR